MSRRKQGSKPQHRSVLSDDGDEMEEARAAICEKPGTFPGQSDLLTCGQCHSTFPLRYILSFIEHKRMQCNPTWCCQEREHQDRSPTPVSEVTDLSPQLSDVGSKSRVQGQLIKRESSIEDESEPSCYICTRCNEEFTSAWFLLQHAQSTHRLQIYLSTEDDRRPLVKQIDDCAHRGLSTVPQPCDISDNKSSNIGPKVYETPQTPKGQFKDTRISSLIPNTSILSKKVFEKIQCLQYDNSPVSVHRGTQERIFLPFQVTSVQEEALNFSTKLRELAGNSLLHSPGLPHQAGASSPFLPSGILRDEETLEIKRRSCEFCGKNFKSLSNLVVHRRCHTGEKPYQCEFCDHACTQSSKLKRHMKIHRIKEGLAIGEDVSVDNDPGKLENGFQDAEESFEELAEDQRKSDDSHVTDAEDVGEQDNQESLQDSPMYISVILSEKYMRGKEQVEELEEETENGNVFEQGTPLEQVQRQTLFNASPAFYYPNEGTSVLKGQRGEPLPISIRPPEFSLPKRSPPLPENLLCYLKKRVKLESESDPLLPLLPPTLHTFYSQWLGNCSDSQSYVKELFPGFRERQPSLFSTSFERSFDPGHSQASPGDDSSEEALSSESGIASGNCTPKQNGLDHRGNCKRSDTCEFCGKVFRNSSNLTVHRRSHTGERPYRCQLCSYACTQSSKLTRHMKTHLQNGKPTFQCEKCNIPFSVFSTLEKHVKKYHGASLLGTELSRANDID